MANLSDKLERIELAVDRIRTKVELPTQAIEEVATAVENMGSGAPVKSNVYRVGSLEERDAITDMVEDDISIVYKVGEFNYDGNQIGNIILLPDVITVETPITANASTSVYYGSTSQERLLFQLSATYYRVRDYKTMTYLAEYTSTDGITYTKTSGDEQLVYSELRPYTSFNSALTPFIFMKGIMFEGIFIYKKDAWNYLDINADTSDPLDIWTGKKVYTNYGMIKGTAGDINGKTFNRSMKYLNTTPSTKTTDMSYMFDNLNTLSNTEVSNYITNWVDTANLTNLAYAFNNNRTSSAITSLNVSGFNTSKVIDMDHAFAHLLSITSLNLSGFDFSKAKSLAYLVGGCEKLTSLSLPTTTQNCVAEDISGIMSQVKTSSINLSNFKLPNVKHMRSSFYGTSCTTLRLPDFTGAKPVDMTMFLSNNKSTTITNLNTIDYSEVEDFTQAFVVASASSFNLRTDCKTTKLKKALSMFSNCSNLTSINLPGLMLSEDADVMALKDFAYECPKLKTIDLRGLNNPGTPNLNVFGMLPTADYYTSSNTETALEYVDLRSFDFTLGNLANYDCLFAKISPSCLIVVKDYACRNWVLSNCRSDLTNIKTAEEYGS